MLAATIGILLSMIIKFVLIIVIVLGGAYALTTYVDLPSIVDALIWIAAGGYALLTAAGLIAGAAIIVAAARN